MARTRTGFLSTLSSYAAGLHSNIGLVVGSDDAAKVAHSRRLCATKDMGLEMSIGTTKVNLEQLIEVSGQRTHL